MFLIPANPVARPSLAQTPGWLRAWRIACVLAAVLLPAGGPSAAALEPSTPLASYGRQTWMMENGLPQNTVQAVVQTRDGFVWLGTDGVGRSDTREKLRHFFEVDRYWVTVAALNALADEGTIERKVVADAIRKYNLDPAKPNPMTV